MARLLAVRVRILQDFAVIVQWAQTNRKSLMKVKETNPNE